MSDDSQEKSGARCRVSPPALSSRPRSHGATTMKAVWFEKQGPAREVLVAGEMPDPTPEAGQVRVRVRVSGLNPSDTKARGGFGAVRKLEYPRIIPGQDGAGEIDRVGPGVPQSRIGERVWVYEA